MTTKQSFLVSCSVVALMLTTPTASWAAVADKLKPHRAVYDLNLSKASDRSGITGMAGRIVYEMTGNVCDGFATKFRFLTNVRAGSRSFTNDQRTSSFESGDGNNYSFVQQSYLNGQLEKEQRGKAKREGDSLVVELSKPATDPAQVEPAIFMTEHIVRLIEAGKAGETVLEADVYDGSDDGLSIMHTTAIIGPSKPERTDVKGEEKDLGKSFSGERAWPVSVSYFNQEAKGQGESLPVYQVSFLLHESGVTRNLTMRYDDYSLKGDLKQIDYLPEESCARAE